MLLALAAGVLSVLGGAFMPPLLIPAAARSALSAMHTARCIAGSPLLYPWAELRRFCHPMC